MIEVISYTIIILFSMICITIAILLRKSLPGARFYVVYVILIDLIAALPLIIRITSG